MTIFAGQDDETSAAAAAAGRDGGETPQKLIAPPPEEGVTPAQIQLINNAYKEAREGDDDADVGARRKEAAFASRELRRRKRTAAATAARTRDEAVRTMGIKPSQTPPIEPTSIKVYNNLRDNIEAGRNIIYEATGEGWDTIRKIFQTLVYATNNCKKFKYIVLASINLINTPLTRKRIIQRFKADKKAYDERGRQMPVPRIPYIQHDVIQQRNQAIYSQMQKLVNLCMRKEGGESDKIGQCVGVGIDLLFVFDNRGKYVEEETAALGTRGQVKRPLFIIPLSRRSKWLTPQDHHLEFSNRNRQKFNDLMQTFAEGTGEGSDENEDSVGDPAAHTNLLNKISIQEWVSPVLGTPPRTRRRGKKKKKIKKKRKGGGRGRTRRRRQKYNIVKSTRKKYHRQKKTRRRKRKH